MSETLQERAEAATHTEAKAAKPKPRPASAEVRAAVRDLYDDYLACMDDGEFAAWPGFFAEDCFYRVTTRENVEGGFPLSLVFAESAAMLRDRVRAIDETMMFGPRSYRRFSSGLRVSEEDGVIGARGNLLVVETLADKPSHIAVCGRFEDTLARRADRGYEIVSRVVVLDTEMMPNSLIYPL